MTTKAANGRWLVVGVGGDSEDERDTRVCNLTCSGRCNTCPTQYTVTRSVCVCVCVCVCADMAKAMVPTYHSDCHDCKFVH